MVALDVDMTTELLYFIDVQAGKIQRISMHGTGLETLVSHGVTAAEGIALDWIGRSVPQYYNVISHC